MKKNIKDNLNIQQQMRHTLTFDTVEELEQYYINYTLPELPEGAEWIEDVKFLFIRTAAFISVNLNGYLWCLDYKFFNGNMRSIFNDVYPEQNNTLGHIKLWPSSGKSFEFIRDLNKFGFKYVMRIELEQSKITDIVKCKDEETLELVKSMNLQIPISVVKQEKIVKLEKPTKSIISVQQALPAKTIKSKKNISNKIRNN